MTAPHYDDGTITVHHGDALDVLANMPDNSIDAIVTDPPAGIAFMSKSWDHDKGGREQWSAWLADIMREALRVTKPGGHAFVWALPRTAHWTACGLEDAGWQIRDRVVHLFGTGFPKSKRLAEGFGTALKPAAEDWWLCRKPTEGSTTANFQAHGTGALNIDGCRVATPDGKPAWDYPNGAGGHAFKFSNDAPNQHGAKTGPAGRWPANVVLDGHTADELDQQSGTTRSGKLEAHHVRNPKDVGILGAYGSAEGERGYGDSGGASRFFKVIPPFKYQAKAPTRERPRVEGVAHPTVKPLELLRWLVRLVTPPGGTVLDPFAGSGTTVEAALLEGFRCVAIEREADYLPLIEARLHRVTPEPRQAPTPRREGNGRDGEASAERRYTAKGGTSFAMKPGPRYDRQTPNPTTAAADALALFDLEEPA